MPSNEDIKRIWEQEAAQEDQRLKPGTAVHRAMEQEYTRQNPPSGSPTFAKSQYGDADEFDREEDPNLKYAGYYDPNSGSAVLIPCHRRTYRMTAIQAVARGIQILAEGEKPDTIIYDNMVPEAKVHILYKGDMLCKEFLGRPVDWPKGHECVSLEHVRQVPEGQISGVTCKSCIDACIARKLR